MDQHLGKHETIPSQFLKFRSFQSLELIHKHFHVAPCYMVELIEHQRDIVVQFVHLLFNLVSTGSSAREHERLCPRQKLPPSS